MIKFVSGAVGMLLLMTAGMFVWMGAQGHDNPLPDAPPPPETEKSIELPLAEEAEEVSGIAPPTPPKAYKASREELRFNRYDRNRDEVITRLELMSSRTKAFKKLDKDGNNLLSFEEWAAATSEKFVGADSNGNGQLTRTEFRSTRPKKSLKRCRC